MFETLFTSQRALARHRTSPCPESRARYLVHCSEQLGYPRRTLQKIAWVLEIISQSMDLCRPGPVTHEEIEFAVDHRASLNHRKYDESRSSRRLFIHIATNWLRFVGYFEEPQESRRPCTHYIDDFARFMRDEIANFLATVWRPNILLDSVSIKDVDDYLAHQGSHGWSRRSLHQLAGALRAFFRYAEGQGWTDRISVNILAPRLYAQEGLPLGPTWDEIRGIIGSFAGDGATDIFGQIGVGGKPAARVRQITNLRDLLAPHGLEPGDLPVGISLAHAHQNLSILVHLKPPLGHGLSREISGA